MRRRVAEEGSEPPESSKPVVVPHDAANEAAVIAAAVVDTAALKVLVRKIRPDHFVAREHAEVWVALTEMSRQGLAYDVEVLEKVGGIAVAAIVEGYAADRPTSPPNLDWHVASLFWDSARANAARGPVPAFLEALRDPKAEPDKVRSLARALASSFDGYQDRRYLHDQSQIVRDQMLEVEQRVAGHACFPYGIEGLDWYDKLVEGERRRRMLPGAAPGQVSVVTGVSGGGKTTFTAHLALGLARQGRRVLYGAWEMRGGMTLELLACISLGWSRTDLMEARGPVATHEGRVQLEERMHAISQSIRFMGNPFRRERGEKGSNDRNLDVIQGYIADAGADVFIADLWKRCLRVDEPSAEEDALIRQQAMAEEMRCHCILLQQQRLKDIEMRPDKRPTREGIKGSGAWVEVADTIIGVHRPALFKQIEDNHLEIFVLKQRYGKWPLGIEFDWEPESGSIKAGRSIDYERPGETNEIDKYSGNGFIDQKSKRRR